MTTRLLIGSVFDRLRELPSNSFDVVVTSPPYWGLRDYDVEGQIGLERTLGEHLDVLVDVFREIRRVLKSHGIVWLNYGDCYAAAPNGKSAAAYKADGTDDRTFRDKPFSTVGAIYDPGGGYSGGGVRGENKGNNSERSPGRIVAAYDPNYRRSPRQHADASGRQLDLGTQGRIVAAQPFYDPKYATPRGSFQTENQSTQRDHGGRIVAAGFLKPKDLCMIPNRLAIALQDDGWWVRSETIWHKPNPMPESVYDRPTSSHEKVFLLTKSEDYYWNAEYAREATSPNTHRRISQDVANQRGSQRANGGTRADRPMKAVVAGANSRVNVDRVPLSRKKRPAGWDDGPGHHGSFHREGREPAITPKSAPGDQRIVKANESFHAATGDHLPTRNIRNVWSIAPKAFKEAHFATFPPDLVRKCLMPAPIDVCGFCGRVTDCGQLCAHYGRVPTKVLDPFGGAGTTALVAAERGFDCTLIELKAEYAEIARKRLASAGVQCE